MRSREPQHEVASRIAHRLEQRLWEPHRQRSAERIAIAGDVFDRDVSPLSCNRERDDATGLFEELASNVATAPPVRPAPLTQEGLLGLFKGDAVGRGVTLDPATASDMLGRDHVEKRSLEVIYDTV